QSLHTNSRDEALSLPTEESVTIALRTQQILAHETGIADTVDPLAGSYCLEALTNEIESRAKELIDRIDQLGGATVAIEQGFIQNEIAESAYRFQREV
ncbi:MAG: methylmalonyl-CoA mutase family protein, partial [candidate division WOR-3 bacterium]